MIVSMNVGEDAVFFVMTHRKHVDGEVREVRTHKEDFKKLMPPGHLLGLNIQQC